jgi:threonine aldolase
MRMIDLRSDTVTRPSTLMRQAMAAAEVGDDVFRDDPTVIRLEEKAASMLGTEGAIFVSSGTQANLLAILCHCNRGEEYIAGESAHCYRFEGGGAAAFGGVQPQPLPFDSDGTLDLERVAATIKPDDPHFPRSRLLCIENTQAGRPLPLAYLQKTGAFVRDKGLMLHMDGARLFNAAVHLGVAAASLASPCDTVSFCLSKGLGAPVGSMLCGPYEVIARARRWRKALGGGMRQAGVLAAAGIFAMEQNMERLSEDHEHARLLASGLREIEEIAPLVCDPQTNMLFVSINGEKLAALTSHLREQGILVAGREALRLVTHLDITADDVTRTIVAFKEYYCNKGRC